MFRSTLLVLLSVHGCSPAFAREGAPPGLFRGTGSHAPVAIPDVYPTPEDTELVVAGPGLIANDYDPNGNGFYLNNATSPIHGSLTGLVTNGAFTYVPPPGFTGIDTFTYRLFEPVTGPFSDYATVAIQVYPDPTRTARRLPLQMSTGYRPGRPSRWPLRACSGATTTPTGMRSSSTAPST